MNISIANENSLILYFSDEITPAVSKRIAFFLQFVQREFASSLLDWVPSYISLLLIFEPTQYDIEAVKAKLLELYQQLDDSKQKLQNKTHQLEICYHPEIAPDLLNLSHKLNVPAAEIAEIHSTNIYTIYAVGFMPNFGFWGIVDPRICHPRHSTPRKLVKAGSVGIAENQTGIYPKDSPGGWQIIGSQPDLANGESPYKSDLKVGDQIKITPITLERYRQRVPKHQS